MDQAPLVEVIEAGRKLIEALVQNDIEVSVGFWAKVGDDDRWYLYVASPLLTTESITNAYRRIHPIVRQVQTQGAWIDPFDIKLISPQSQTAEAAAELRGNHRGITRAGATQLGGETIEGAIIYPAVQAVKAK